MIQFTELILPRCFALNEAETAQLLEGDGLKSEWSKTPWGSVWDGAVFELSNVAQSIVGLFILWGEFDLCLLC